MNLLLIPQPYWIIKKLVENDENKNNAALRIGCTRRTINRLIIKYKDEGKNRFVHGNRERKPKHSISNEIKSDIIDFYSIKYYDANFKHFSELSENTKILLFQILLFLEYYLKQIEKIKKNIKKILYRKKRILNLLKKKTK